MGLLKKIAIAVCSMVCIGCTATAVALPMDTQTADAATTTSVQSVRLETYQDNGENHWLILVFDQATNSELVYGSDSTVYTDSVKQNVLINNVSIQDIITNSGGTESSFRSAVWAQTDNKCSLRLPFKVGSSDNIFTPNAENTITVSSGFTTYNGNTTSATFTDTFTWTKEAGSYTVGSFTYENKYTWGGNMTFDKAGAFPDQDNGQNHWFYLTFSQLVTSATSYEIEVTDAIKNYIKFNGRTIGEWNADSATTYKFNAVYRDAEANANKIRLMISSSDTTVIAKNDINTIEVLQGFTTKNGNKLKASKAFSFYWYEDASMKKEMPCDTNVAPTGSTVSFDRVSTFNNPTGNGYDWVYLHFSGAVSNATTDVSVLTKYVYNHIKINGVSIATMNATNSSKVSTLWPSAQKQQLILFVPQNQTYSLKHDGSDLFEITQGFVGQNGVAIDKSYSTMEEVTPTGVVANFSSLSPFADPAGNGYDWLYLTFDADVTTQAQNSTLTRFVQNYIRINGKTVGEMNTENSGAVSVLWNPGNVATKLLLYIRRGESTSLKLNGNDRVEILDGFIAQNGTKINAVDKVYRDNTLVDTSTVAKDYALVAHNVSQDGVTFRLPFTFATLKNTSADLTKIVWNGQTLDTYGASATATFTQDSVLEVFIASSLMKGDNTDNLTFKQGLVIDGTLALPSDLSLTYYPKYVYLSSTATAPSVGSVTLQTVGTPRIFSNGDFAVNLVFSSAVTTERMQNVTADFMTLMEKTKHGDMGYYYTTAMLDTLALMDIPQKALTCIKINGKTLQEWGDGVEVCLYGNEMMISISKTHANAITEITSGLGVSVLQGLRTTTAELNASGSFVYNADTKTWATGEYQPPVLPPETSVEDSTMDSTEDNSDSLVVDSSVDTSVDSSATATDTESSSRDRNSSSVNPYTFEGACQSGITWTIPATLGLLLLAFIVHKKVKEGEK